MGILRYDEPSLMRELDRIAMPLRVIFAAAVAERLLPAYLSFSHKAGRGNPYLLTQILERLWQDIQGIRMDPKELQQNIDLAMELIPGEDDIPWFLEQAGAEDAAAAIAYALCCRQNGKSQESAWAARRGFETLDYFVTTRDDIDPNDRVADERALSDPLIQEELLRQQRDLRELMAADLRDVSTLAQKIRQRAKAESISVFNNGS